MKQAYHILTGAKRLEDVPMSGIRVMMNKSAALVKEGYPVISFGAGEPDFNTPEPVKQAAIKALLENHTHYGANWGQLELRKEIAKKLLKDTGTDYDPEKEILVTCGGAEGIHDVIMSVVDPGDEVIVFKPGFVSYEAVLKLAGGKIINCNLRPELDFQIDLEQVEALITDRTKMIIINNPNNPTGVVYKKELLAGLAKLAGAYNILIFSDEIYGNLTYDEAEFISMAAFPDMKQRTVVVSGFSKTYAMTGWRLGYVAAPYELMQTIVKEHQYVSTSLPTFLQIGVARSMNLPETLKEVDRMRKEFSDRRQRMLDGLDRLEKISYVKPYGAFYCMVNVSETGMSGEEFSDRLLREKYVATVPAFCLGEHCGDFIRISFAASGEAITEGLDRIREFLSRC